MNINKLPTPSIVLDIDTMEDNIKRVHELAKKHNKEIWPMTKTHKSKELMQYQIDNGATGLLCGTIDECEAATELNVENIMYAYPVSDPVSIARIVNIAKKSNFIIRIDGIEAAKLINEVAETKNIKINYTLIIDCGLGRFGIQKEDALNFLNDMKQFKNLVFKGISSHPGQVYGVTTREGVTECANQEMEVMNYVLKQLKANGYEVEYVTSGSTPTFFDAVEDKGIQIYHPGNYIFNDAIQMSIEIASEDQCALSVIASIVSNPKEGLYICDAGAKCLGLDKGAHGNDSIVGHGKIIGHPDAIIDSLSEEVGKIKAKQGEFKVGDRIRMIPNHSCSTANLASYFYGFRGDNVEKIYSVNVRGNSKKFDI
ncbi:alanine racemase [Anaerosphaera multitolerans]|uniref:Amino-acid racemase n=1 Tax=Anaerosphaera multitolerans TaxID=2487351 RepID=A0A437S6A1_9FIRM|nr:alanine racemase [Anaerosphaera multitolerans]RVU54534.1 amino-acid racemase [Anaerosphaera multitolerans]